MLIFLFERNRFFSHLKKTLCYQLESPASCHSNTDFRKAVPAVPDWQLPGAVELLGTWQLCNCNKRSIFLTYMEHTSKECMCLILSWVRLKSIFQISAFCKSLKSFMDVYDWGMIMQDRFFYDICSIFLYQHKNQS